MTGREILFRGYDRWSKLIQRLKCRFSNPPVSFRHKPLRIVKRLSNRVDLIECLSCWQRFAISYDVCSVLPYEGTIKNFYETSPIFNTGTIHADTEGGDNDRT